MTVMFIVFLIVALLTGILFILHGVAGLYIFKATYKDINVLDKFTLFISSLICLVIGGGIEQYVYQKALTLI